MTRAIIYTRTSTTDQALGHEAQEAECRALAARLGAEVIAVHSDYISGSVPPAERDGFVSALAELEAGDLLIMWRRDRLGRSVIHNAVAEKLTAARGCRVVTSDVSTDDTAEGGMMRSILDAIAEYERALIIARTRAALAAKRAKGLRIGNLPLGQTTNENGELMVNEAEQEIINKVRAKRAEGTALDALVGWCQQEGITARSGLTPSRSTIAKWIEGVELTAPIKRKPMPPRKPRRKLEETSSCRGLTALVRDLHRQGLSLRAIAAEVSQRGYLNSKGNAFHSQNIKRIIDRFES